MRLIQVGKKDDSNAKIIASALLSSWQPGQYQAMEIQDLLTLPLEIQIDVAKYYDYLNSSSHGIDAIGMESDLELISKIWGQVLCVRTIG